jgi:hypothetical protein
MKKKIFILLTTLIMSFTVSAQFESTPADGSSSSKEQKKSKKSSPVKQQSNIKDKIVVGGGLDLQFGDITFIGVTPLVGYYITDKLLAGGIFTYRFVQYNYLVPKYSTSTFGVAPFVRYDIFKGIFAHVEYEALYGEWNYRDDPFWITSFFVGGGYNARIGNRGFAGVYILWNLTEDPNNRIYNNPVLRFSFGVGF